MAKTKKSKKKNNKKLAALAGGLALAATGYSGVAVNPSVAMAANVSTLTNPSTNKVILEEHPSDAPQHEGDNTVYGEGASQEAQSAEENVVMGRDASVKVYNGSEDSSFDTVIGHKANVTGSAGTAVGAAANVNSMFGGTAVGTASTAKGGQMGTAVGYMSEAIGNFATADGANAKATAKATALGANAKATAGNAVALGQGSVADEENTVSVGKAGSERRITNVEAGVNDTDAVNVSQLRDAISGVGGGTGTDIDWTRINTEGSKVTNSKYSTVLGGQENSIKSAENTDIIGGRLNKALSGVKDGAVVGGENNKVSGVRTVVVGGVLNTASNESSAVVAGRGNTASGIESAVVGGTENVASGHSAVAIGGNKAEASGENAVAASGGHATGKNTFAFGQHGIASNENAIAFQGEATGKNTIAIGSLSKATNENAISLLGKATDKNTVAIGITSQATEENSVVIGPFAKSTAKSAVAVGALSEANEVNTFSVGSSSNNRRIVNVAAGIHDTDAVNVSQLKEAMSSAGSDDNKANITLNNITNEGEQVITNLADSVDDTAAVTTSDENLLVTSSKDGLVTTYDVSLNRDLNVDSLSVGDKVYISAEGFNANLQKIINVADGTVSKDSKDAINGGQLYDVKQEINTDLDGKANVTLNNITNEGQKVITDLAESVEKTSSVKAGDSNVVVDSKVDGNNTEYTVKLADDINAKSYSVGDKTYISETGINANSQKVVNVADGTVAKDSKDAVNGGQLYDVKQEINTDLDGKANVTLNNITNEGQKVITDLADSVDDTAEVTNTDGNLTVSSKKEGNLTTYNVNLADDINAKTYSVGDKTYISETGINANSQKVVNIADGTVAKDSKDAVNGGQLYDVKQEINTDLDGKANVTLNNITNEGQKVITDLAESVEKTSSVKAGDSNVVVDSKVDGNNTEYTVKLADNINVKSYSVGDKTYISETGINANSQKVVNVADGTVAKDSKDAVNGGQLYDVKQEINTDLDGKANVTLNNITNEGQKVITDLAESVEKTSSVKAGDSNVVVDSKVDGNNTEYTVKLADDINAKSYSVGSKTYISETGVNANNQKVVNVADGTVAKDSKDAVNGGQLYQVKQAVDNIDWTLINTKDSSVEDKDAHSTVVGGENNQIKRGEGKTDEVKGAIILGGTGNGVTNDNAAVLGGQDNIASGVNAVAIGGTNTQALGTNSVAMAGGIADGEETVAIKGVAANKNAIAVGKGTAAGANSIMIGQYGVAGAENTTAIGSNAMATGEHDTVIGNKAVAMYGYAVAVGDNAQAAGRRSVAMGVNSHTAGQSSIAIGDGAMTHDESAVSIGTGASSTNVRSVAIGENAHANGDNAYALGHDSYAVGNDSIVMGTKAIGRGKNAIVLGTNSWTSGENGIAIGISSQNAGNNNIAIGNSATVFGENSVVIGNNTKTEYTDSEGKTHYAKNSVALGNASIADEDDIVSVGSDEQTRKITHVKAGEKDTDAVNVSQLKTGLTNITNEFDVKLENKADIDLGNINIDGRKVITDLAESIEKTSEVTNTDKNLTVTAKTEGNNTVYDVNLARNIDADSYSVGGNVYISATGINANSQKITNVARGEVSKDSADAVNGSQLYEIEQIFAGDVTNKADIDLGNINIEGKKVITDLAESVEKTSSVKAGDSNVVVDSKVDGNNTEYTVKLADDINAKSYSVGDKTYISETGINANSQKVVNVADGTVAKDSKDAVNGGQLYDMKQEINTDLDGKANVTLNNITNEGQKVITDLADSVDDTAEVTNTDGNLTVSSKKEGNLTTYNVDLADDINAKTYSVGDKTYISETGVNANSQKIVNVADGTVAKDSKDAVNGGQLYDVKQEINTDLDGKANVTLNNITNEGQKVITDLAESVEKTSSVKAGDSNVVVDSKVDGNNTEYTVKLADDINAKSYSVGDKTYISGTGINANSQKVVNVADGTVAKDSKDAVNGGQLYDVKQEINTDLDGKANVTLNNITNEGKKVITDLADSVDDTAEVTNTDGNLTVSSKKEGNLTTYNVNLAKDIHADSYSVGDKTYISETGINANSQKVVNVADGTVAKDSKDAVNGGQLYDVQQNINVDLSKKADVNLSNITNEGQKVITDLAESVEKTSSVKAGDSNVVVSEKKDGNNTEYTVKLADDINAKSFSVDGKTYISNTGINANFQKVVNVADGTVAKDSKDAVNGGQLYDVQQTISTNLDGKANISLNNINVEGKKVITDLADSVDDTAEVTNTDGNLTVSSKKDGNTTTYDVNLAKDIHADSYSVGDKTYISNTGINANSQKITNVADGAVDKDSKDAVNGSQLYEMQQSINVDLSKKADIDLSNISIDGRKVITDLADSVDDTAEVKAGDNNVVVSSKKDGNTTTYTVKLADNINAQSFSVGGNIYISSLGINANNKRIVNVAAGVDDTDAVNMAQLKEAVEKASDPLAVKYDSDEKTTITLAGNDGTTITNVKAGELSKTSTDAVNGSQLYETNQRVEQNTKDIKTLQTDVSNIKSDVTTNTTNIGDLQEADKLNVKYTNTTKVEVHLGGNGGTVISNVANATNDDEAVNYGQLKDAISDIHVEADKNAVRYTDDSHEKAFLDGENGTVLDGVADGEISEDSMEAVNGSQLYAEQEARKAADEALSKRIGFLDENKEYNFIKAGDNVSQNLEALDAAIIVKDDGNEISIGKDSATKVINVAGKGGEPRVITGVRTDENDGSSAANVDYVNQKAKESQRYAQGIGAQAAAMATLHPLDWDKNDKVSVSASVGAYKSEVAGAVGAYYRPDRKSMVSFQGAFGKNDNMFGIGFSKKLGDQETEELTAEDAEALRTEVSDLRSKNSELENKYEKLEAQNRQILEMLSKQSGLNTTTVSAIVAPEGNEDESPADDEEIFGEEE